MKFDLEFLAARLREWPLPGCCNLPAERQSICCRPSRTATGVSWASKAPPISRFDPNDGRIGIGSQPGFRRSPEKRPGERAANCWRAALTLTLVWAATISSMPLATPHSVSAQSSGKAIEILPIDRNGVHQLVRGSELQSRVCGKLLCVK